MSRVFNFSAGPACLPEEVLREAAEDMLSFKGSGMSVMEMSHRSLAYDQIIKETEQDIRTLANIPDDYAVLFLQGGATLQFAMAPINLSKSGKADYITTGHWAQKAAAEAARYTDVKEIASSEGTQFDRIPDLSKLPIREGADYVHLCENNTIYGTQYHTLPETGGIPLVSDQSSCVFSRPLDITRYGLIYAGAQKNIGPAGLTLVIVRKDLIKAELDHYVPLMLRYDTHIKSGSMHNTPPTYAIYITGKVMKWLLRNGGLNGAQKRNEEKAGLLYDALDRSQLFYSPVKKDSRSLMNIVFTSGDEATDADFIKGAEALGLMGIKGYRTVGGMRASLYNAMTRTGVEALVSYMKDFERSR
ncbi:MAG: 3-phosphoserine/phosphohydroxythreonine transaminase [Clostridiales bacterium]|nr:3-phosphoserine/phosphohydroxythreonine transaminase [Clostridiales bacterium]